MSIVPIGGNETPEVVGTACALCHTTVRGILWPPDHLCPGSRPFILRQFTFPLVGWRCGHCKVTICEGCKSRAGWKWFCGWGTATCPACSQPFRPVQFFAEEHTDVGVLRELLPRDVAEREMVSSWECKPQTDLLPRQPDSVKHSDQVDALRRQQSSRMFIWGAAGAAIVALAGVLARQGGALGDFVKLLLPLAIVPAAGSALCVYKAIMLRRSGPRQLPPEGVLRAFARVVTGSSDSRRDAAEFASLIDLFSPEVVNTLHAGTRESDLSALATAWGEVWKVTEHKVAAAFPPDALATILQSPLQSPETQFRLLAYDFDASVVHQDDATAIGRIEFRVTPERKQQWAYRYEWQRVQTSRQFAFEVVLHLRKLGDAWLIEEAFPTEVSPG